MRFDKVPSTHRRVYYDDYAGRFYFESEIEALDRLCRQKDRQVQTLNKWEQRQLHKVYKETEGAHQIFEAKLKDKKDTARASLKDMLAHKRALAYAAKINQAVVSYTENTNYGKYGVGASKSDLSPLIEMEKRRLNPSYVRCKQAEKLLEQRKQMDVIDRQIDTGTLFSEWKKRARSTPCPGEDSKTSSKLVLPPIQVNMGLVLGNQCDTVTSAPHKPEDNFPSVFITHCSKADE